MKVRLYNYTYIEKISVLLQARMIHSKSWISNFSVRCYADRGIATANCPSIRNVEVSWGWNSSIIISLLVSLGSSLSADSQHVGSSPRGTSWNFGQNMEGDLNSGFWRAKALISLKLGKIRPRLLLRSNRKSYVKFRLVPKSTASVTLKYRDQIGRNCTLKTI